MSQADETFFTIIGCMDGRVQLPRMEYGKKKFGALYPDTITEAGTAGIVANNPSQEFLDSLKKKIDISLNMHHSKGIIVSGHAECAGNSVPDDIHKDNIHTGVEMVKKLTNGSVPVVGIFVKRSASNPLQWEVEELSA